jgi:hypothetical protein
MREVYDDHARELQQRETELAQLIAGDLAKVNDLARKLELPSVIVPRAPAGDRRP